MQRSVRHANKTLPHTVRGAALPWSLRAWPPLLWQASHAPQVPLHHLDTRVTSPVDGVEPLAGQTLWGGSLSAGDAGVAWDWIQIARGVVALADPMSVVTNLRLVGREGEVLTTLEAALYLNELVHGLPWQTEVLRRLLQPLARPRNTPLATQ